MSVGERLHQTSDAELVAFLKPVTDELAAEARRQMLIERAVQLPELIANYTRQLGEETNEERKAAIASAITNMETELADAAKLSPTVVRDVVDAADMERVSYAFAFGWAQQFPSKWRLQGEAVCEGFGLTLRNESLPFDAEEYNAIIYYVTNGITYEKKLGQQKGIAAAFLLENGAAEGVTTLPSGLQYKRLSPPAVASAPQPSKASRVVYHARGGRHRGRASFSTGGMDADDEATHGPKVQPLTDRVIDLIDGLQEGLQLMRVGETFKFWIEGKLAFGDLFAFSGTLFPHDVLAIEIKLIDVEDLSDAELATAPATGENECEGGECARGQFQLSSDSFRNGTQLPGRHWCEAGRGGGYSPHLVWTSVPDGTKSFVLLAASDASDATQLLVHWLVYDIPANVTALKAGALAPEGAKAGQSSMADRSFYLPPCPTVPDVTETVVFRVFALDVASVAEERDLSWTAIADAVHTHMLGGASLHATVRKGDGAADVHRRALHKVTDAAADMFG